MVEKEFRNLSVPDYTDFLGAPSERKTFMEEMLTKIDSGRHDYWKPPLPSDSTATTASAGGTFSMKTLERLKGAIDVIGVEKFYPYAESVTGEVDAMTYSLSELASLEKKEPKAAVGSDKPITTGELAGSW